MREWKITDQNSDNRNAGRNVVIRDIIHFVVVVFFSPGSS